MRFAFTMLSLLFFGCTDDRAVEEPIQAEPVEDTEAETAPNAAPAPSDDSEMDGPAMNSAGDADLQEADGAESTAPEPALNDAAAPEQPAGGKGGIISSGVKAKQKKCKAIRNLRYRKKCLEQEEPVRP